MSGQPGRPFWQKLLIAFAVGLAIFLILTAARGGFSQTDPAQRWLILSDALFVPGILMLSLGLLVWAADGGVFDMLKFGIQKALSVVMTKKRRDALPRTFYDYKLEREAKPKARIGYLMAAGLVLIALAGAALLLYGQYEPVF